MKYLIGIDIGTSSTKTVLFDTLGNTIASSSAEYPMYQPQNGWAEQRPEDWWNATVSTLKQVTKEVNPSDIVGVGLAGQMHGLVMLNEGGEVIRPAIIWCDGRTSEECDEITEKVGKKRLIDITANPAIAGFTASKILWIQHHEPENYSLCRHILLPKDYVRYRLTGVFATDASDASGMQLLDIKMRDWSDEVLQKLNIDKNLLPKVYESPEVTGKITDEAGSLTGLLSGTIVVGGAGDNAAAAVGTGVVEDGKAFTTIGTSGVVFAHTSKMNIDPLGRVHTFCAAVPNEWHVMGVTQAAGLSLKWFRDNFCESELAVSKSMGVDVYYLMNTIAEKSKIGCDRLIYLPYLMGERTPHLNPNARGVFFGLSAMHTKGDMLRAVMEGVSYSLMDCLMVLKDMGISTSDMVVCGGGGNSSLWRAMLADVYDCAVKTMISNEGAALGAAILAGVGAGVFVDVVDGCGKIIKAKTNQKPSKENVEEYKKYYALYKKLYPCLVSCFDEI
ncbi:MAG: xylulokinase [Oscillospiraceae bacterium]